MTSKQSQNNERVIVDQPPGRNNPPKYAAHQMPQTGGYQQPNTICPPGLQCLIPVDRLFIDQRIDPFEAATGVHAVNQYTVLDVSGQPLYVIHEQSDWFMRVILGRSRSFEMPIYDIQGREALLIKRPICFIGDSMKVFYNRDSLLGTIEKTVISCVPHYRIYDEHNVEKLKICGPPIWLMCTCSYKFAVLDANGNHVGKIKKQWSGIGREIFTNADIFGVSFPRNLSVKGKAMLLAAAILIDFDYFEQRR